MARGINLIIILLEIIALCRTFPKFKWKTFVFYTQISNTLTLLVSAALVIFGPRRDLAVLRMTSVSMLLMTFFVTTCVLVPFGGSAKNLLFSVPGIFVHLICPILSCISYFFFEYHPALYWVLVPVVISLIYGLLMVCLNDRGIVEGPYPFFEVKKIGKKAAACWIAGLIVLSGICSLVSGLKAPAKTDLTFIYVHGLSGWGSYDLRNEVIPYWGMTSGDVVRYMDQHGYSSYAASVDPDGSAWDRACELYAQLMGCRVDYGAAHSARCHHERFGEDYSMKPLLADFEKKPVVLIGHSFGGATIRLFSEILRNGSEEERLATPQEELSPFFAGGQGENLFALVLLAAPTNGTTAYDLYEDPSFDVATVDIPEEYEKNSDAVSKFTKARADERIREDYAAYDMHIDNALALNDTITTFDDVYYFALPFSTAVEDPNGGIMPDPAITEQIFLRGATIMSKYTGRTAGGFALDASWQANDGLVNTCSAGAPLGARSAAYTEGEELLPGIWYVMPVIRGDHMYAQGGLTKRHDVRPMYRELAQMLAGIRKAGK
ncbi:MAG: hypothetical protein K6A92_11945 [Lachnospiraceae bacterium]|nr:hypothetical protein [Lachnospiraceae bacterium]